MFFFLYQTDFVFIDIRNLISENVLFFISRMWISYIKSLIFWYQKIFFWFHKFEFLKSDNDFWYPKMSCIFYIRFFIDIRNWNFWYPKMCYFFISDIKNLFFWYQKFIFWNHKFELEFLFFYIKNVNFWYQKFTFLI